MPKPSLYMLVWSEEDQCYEFFTHGLHQFYFHREEESTWLAWLDGQNSFAFQGQHGHLSVIKEMRSRGAGYWYAYSTRDRQTRKRYLGRTAALTFSHLEEVALALAPPRTLEPVLSVSNKIPTFSSVQEELPMLESRLSRPSISASLVERERLQKLLDGVLTHRLTLLSASAGWGKTTLLSSWAARSSTPVAWLSLDSQDNSLPRFWRSIIAALQICHPGVGETTLALLRSPQALQASVLLTILLNDLNSIVELMVLILDDYHVIEEPVIHDSLLFFLEHLPAHFHLVIASRIDPPLILSRRRVRGQMLEIRDMDLRFCEDETSRFFRQSLDFSLSDDEVSGLEARTEGWIAGLQLAALAMQRHENPSSFVQTFTGSHRYLLDYIQEEILVRLPVPLQSFLLQTAILNRMSASLCQAVTTEPASQNMLEAIERANLFLVSLDDKRQWYRYHDLFRETLLACLNSTRPELVSHLHQRAANWFESQGELREAITHALSAEDFSFAASLMERVIEQVWLNGEIKIVYPWIMMLPDSVIHNHARFVLTASLYLLNFSATTFEEQRTSVHFQVGQMIARVETALRLQEGDSLPTPEIDQPLSRTEVVLLRQRASLLRLWSTAILDIIPAGDIERLRLCYEQMQKLDTGDEIVWRMPSLSTAFILHFTFLRESASLVPLLLDAKRYINRSGEGHFATIKVMQWLALTYWDAGELRLAYRECLSALELLQRVGGHAIQAGYFSLALAVFLYEWNQLEEARTILRKVIQDGQVWQQTDLQVSGYFFLLQADLASGDFPSAQQNLQKMEDLVDLQGLTFYSSWLIECRVWYWLATNDLQAADRWVLHTTVQKQEWKPNLIDAIFALVRVHLVHSRNEPALEVLEHFSAKLDRPENIDITIRFLVLRVWALSQAEKFTQAQEVALRLLQLSEAGGYIRVYLEAGKPMQQIVESLLRSSQNELFASGVSNSYVSQILNAFKQESHRLASAKLESPLNTSQVQHLSMFPSLAEPLTRREWEVLQQLAGGATNQEIATNLVISLATVKKHVSRLLSKLAAENRTHAVARARELSLL